jgi:hypothetical protein
VKEPESPRGAAEREALARAVEDSPLKGKPLPARFRLTPETVDRYLTAAGGPLVYMRRLHEIEEEIASHQLELRAARAALAAECPGDFSGRWRAVAAEWDFAHVNGLIEKHNRYYPIEARLPMDPRTGDYAPPKTGHGYPLEPLDADWILERFPPDLAAVPEGRAEASDQV